VGTSRAALSLRSRAVLDGHSKAGWDAVGLCEERSPHVRQAGRQPAAVGTVQGFDGMMGVLSAPSPSKYLYPTGWKARSLNRLYVEGRRYPGQDGQTSKPGLCLALVAPPATESLSASAFDISWPSHSFIWASIAPSSLARRQEGSSCPVVGTHVFSLLQTPGMARLVCSRPLS